MAKDASGNGWVSLVGVGDAGHSTREIAATLTAEGQPTKRGGTWSSATVSRIVARYNDSENEGKSQTEGDRVYGVWQTGERFRYGQRPWAISENQLDLLAWALKHIPQDGLKHLCFAEKVGSIQDLADANWKLTGHYYKKYGIKMRNIEPEKYEHERATEVNDGYRKLTADEQAWVTVNIDATEQD